MSRTKTAASGAGWTIATQLFVSLAQFVVSGVTARIFSPADFGGFAAAVGLMGLLTLFTTAGLPSHILKEDCLSANQLRSIRLVALLTGILTAVAFVLIAPMWLKLLQASEGEQYILSMVVAQAVGPWASVESALLRREITPKRDSVAFLASFIISASLGLTGALVIREAWVLGVPLATAPIILGSFAYLLQRDSYLPGARLHGKSLFEFTRKVTAQNVGFMVLQQAPGWAVSTTLGAGALGHYSKGLSLVQMPATALTAIQSRIAQPHWRNAGGPAAFQKAICDAALLSAGLSFPAFIVLSANGSSIVRLWLGPGWELAGVLASTLAIGCAVSVPFTLIAGSFEMRGDFRPARVAQWCMALTMLPAIAATVYTEDVIWAGRALVLSQGAALVCLIYIVKWRNAGTRRTLVRGLLMQAAWAALIGSSGLIARALLPPLTSDISQLAVALLVSGVVWTLTFRWHASSSVLARRGFKLPWLLRPLSA